MKTPTQPEFEHKGITITMDAVNGEFSARVRGRNVRKPSLAAMKKFIDSKEAFVPFDAIRFHYDGITRVHVIGKTKARGSHRHTWILKSGSDTSQLHPLSAEKKLKEYRKLRADNERTIEKLRTEQHKFLAAIPVLDANK